MGRRSKHTLAWIVGVAAPCLGAVGDYVTGRYAFDLFYGIPVLLVGLRWGARWAVFVAALVATLWLVVSVVAGHDLTHPIEAAWNFVMTFSLLLVVALYGGLRHASEHVKELRGLLPICAWCKKVRDDQGYWTTVERYVTEHSDATFSHGICPGCSDRLVAGRPRGPADAPSA